MNNPFIAGTGELEDGHLDKEWIAVGPDPSQGRCAEAIYMAYNEFPPDEDGDVTIRFTKLTTQCNSEMRPKLTLYHAWGNNRNDPINGNNPDVFFIQSSIKP